jgi:hypothetical protein
MSGELGCWRDMREHVFLPCQYIAWTGSMQRSLLRGTFLQIKALSLFFTRLFSVILISPVKVKWTTAGHSPRAPKNVNPTSMI